MIAVDHQSRYNLRSKNIDDNSKPVAQPNKNKDTLKIPAEKQVVEPSRPEIPIAVNHPSLEVKISHKLPHVFNFENEIQKIKIHVHLIEFMKNNDFKKTFMKSLQPPPIDVASDFINPQDGKPAIILGPLVEDIDDSTPPFYLSLNIHDKILHNFLMDSGASHNLMPKVVMDELGL